MKIKFTIFLNSAKANLNRYVFTCLSKGPSDSISQICMGKLFHTVGAAMENDLAPKVAYMHPLGRSKTIEQCNHNE